MGFLEAVGAVVVGLIGLAFALAILTILWGYIQATGGYIRARRIADRYSVTLWKGRKPRLFAVRMIHWQAWNMRNWSLGGLTVPWTFMQPIAREEWRYYG